MTRLLKIETVAERLAVSPLTVRKWVAAGKLPIIRIGRSVRVKEDDLLAVIRTGSEPIALKKATDTAR